MGNESDKSAKPEVSLEPFKVADAKDVDLFGNDARAQELLAQQKLAQDALKPYDFTLKPWMLKGEPIAPFSRGPDLKPEDFTAGPPLKFERKSPDHDLNFRMGGLADEDKQRRIDMEWRSRREKMQDQIADRVIGPGFGRVEWQNGSQSWRLDYLNTRNCKVRGVGLCLTVKNF